MSHAKICTKTDRNFISLSLSVGSIEARHRLPTCTHNLATLAYLPLAICFLLQLEAHPGRAQSKSSPRLLRLHGNEYAVAIGHHDLTAAAGQCECRLCGEIISREI